MYDYAAPLHSFDEGFNVFSEDNISVAVEELATFLFAVFARAMLNVIDVARGSSDNKSLCGSWTLGRSLSSPTGKVAMFKDYQAL